MNWDTIKGNWKQFSGKAKQQWGKLTDNELTEIDGSRDVLVGKLQESYGYSKECAQKAVAEFESNCGDDSSCCGGKAPGCAD